MEKPTIVQRIINNSSSPMDVAIKYYSILSLINSLNLTQREIQLLAFIATRGSISSGEAKESFKKLYGSSKASIGNLVWMLTRKGILARRNKKAVLHPQLALNFSNTIVLNLTLNNGGTTES
jgi:hypothetical protein